MKILIADDSKMTRENIARKLNLPDIDKIIYASNGEEALTLFKEELPDLVTLDITMPKINGVECTHRMLVMRPDVKILIISAIHDHEKATEVLLQGAQGYLTKPFTEEQLNTALRELI